MFVMILYNLVEIFIYTLTYKALLGKKGNIFNIKSIILLVVSSVMQGISYYFELEALYQLIIPVIAGLINCILITDSKKQDALTFMPLNFIMSSLINVAASLVISKVLGISQLEVVDSEKLTVISECCGLGIVLILYLLLRNRIQGGFFKTKAQYFIFLIGGMSLYMMVGFAQFAMEGSVFVTQKICEILEVVSLLGTLIFFVLFMMHQVTLEKVLRYRLENERYNVFINEQEKYYKTIILEDERRRKLKHDMKSHLLVIGVLAKEEKMTELINYLEEMDNFLGNEKVEQYIGISAVDTVINECRIKAEEAGVKWHFEYNKTTNVDIDMFELCIIFSNLLCNAVEAASKLMGEKEICVEVATIQNRFLLQVKNSCDESINITQRPETTKSDATYHGYGLKNVEDIVEKHNGEISYCGKDGEFCVNVVL